MFARKVFVRRIVFSFLYFFCHEKTKLMIRRKLYWGLKRILGKKKVILELEIDCETKRCF